MASRAVSLVSNGLLRRLHGVGGGRASFSARVNDDPSKYIAGLTPEDVENNPTLKAYFEANIPEYGKEEGFKVQKKDMLGNPLPDPPISRLTLEEEAAKAAKDPNYVPEFGDDVDIPIPFPFNIRPLNCYKRDLDTEEGSRRCNRLRRQKNMIPGVIYGSDPTQNIQSLDPSSNILVKTPFSLIQREMDLYTYHNFPCRVYDLTLYEQEGDEGEDGEDTGRGIFTQRVVPQDIQHHPVQHNMLYCVNYLRYHPGRPVKIPIQYINEEESPALKRGGFIVPVNRFISCVIEDGVSIPEFIELDCTEAKLKEVMRLDRLIFPDGVKPSKRVNKETFLVGPVYGRRAEVTEEEEES